MYKIKTLNSIAAKGLDKLEKKLFNVSPQQERPDAILVRSAVIKEEQLSEPLLCIARAGAGVNNIPIIECSKKGIAVFNTPGANSNAVKEMVISALIFGSRNVIDAANWAGTLKGEQNEIPKLVEKGKSQFTGPEIYGKKLGVVGLGAIGVLVANAAAHLGMDVYGYDPYISIDAAWNLSRNVIRCQELDEILSYCDYITLHLPVTTETAGIINNGALQGLKKGARLLNFARSELVSQTAVLEALCDGRLANYITDFPSEKLLFQKGVICIPHLGASTPESEDNCAELAAISINKYLTLGTVRNSVNLPNVELDKFQKNRLCIINKNEKGVLSAVTSIASDAGLNIDNLVNKSKNDLAYTVIDFASELSQELIEQIKNTKGIIRIRALKA